MNPLSGKFAITYKKILLILIPVIGGAFVIFLLTDGISFFRFFVIAQLGYLCFIIYNRISLLKEVSYDSEHLYIIDNEQQEIIPLEAIARVELKSIGGQWDLHFKPGYTNREKLVFLPSIIYPLNYKKIDEMVNAFRKQISIAKQHSGNKQNYMMGLTSYNA